ncbi:MAG: hypothetical protein HY718_18730 [Planctomycetes bacterium]|nr:hypothetical protein [Planctomycetota bacterium]
MELSLSASGRRTLRASPAAAVFAVMGLALGAQRLRAAPPAAPAKPVYPDLPAKTQNATGLIVITHGWNSSPKYWPDGENGTGNDPEKGLKAKIRTQLGADANKWDIVAFDWSNIQAGGKQFGAATGTAFSLAGNLKLADQARLNGMDIGTRLGMQVNAQGYEKIHFYSHSAGSWLNDRAADRIKALGGNPTVQQTFFDTFMPLKDVNDDLGDTAKFALQYVDAREYDNSKPFTNATLRHAYNLDVTALDPQPDRGFTSGAHGWPHEWYRQTTDDPAAAIAHGWGYNRALEKGAMPNFGDTIGTLTAQKNKRDALPPPAPPKSAKQAPVTPVPGLKWRERLQSLDGVSVDAGDDTIFTLSGDVSGAEPQAWIEATLDVIEPVNLLHFDYEFETLGLGGQGLRAAYLADELLFHGDERFARTWLSGPDAEYLLLGDPLTPGTHSLSFRLDPFSDDPYYSTSSTVTISDVWLTYADVPEPATLLLAAATAMVVIRRRTRRRWRNV